MGILFNKPFFAEQAYEDMLNSLSQLRFEHADYSLAVANVLQQTTTAEKVLLTNSCTSALEMSAILLNLKPGDEVIMPSYTFVSTANAFVLRGAVPVFVDIRPDTLNLNEKLIEAAITEKTKAIVVVHYAGVAAEMKAITAIADQHQLVLIEDAAQAIGAAYHGQALGSFGALATLSFHYTKNISSGFGGALLINDQSLIERAQVIWQKGTDREAFIQGHVDKYTWIDIGSSYLMPESNAALLHSQLQNLSIINDKRRAIWHGYQQAFAHVSSPKLLAQPTVLAHCWHNGHCYYLIFDEVSTRDQFIHYMHQHGIQTCFHYIPLHNSPAGLKYGKSHGHLYHTEHYAARLVRLPLHYYLTEAELNIIIERTLCFMSH